MICLRPIANTQTGLLNTYDSCGQTPESRGKPRIKRIGETVENAQTQLPGHYDPRQQILSSAHPLTGRMSVAKIWVYPALKLMACCEPPDVLGDAGCE